MIHQIKHKGTEKVSQWRLCLPAELLPRHPHEVLNLKAKAEGVCHCVGMWAMGITGSGDKPFVV